MTYKEACEAVKAGYIVKISDPKKYYMPAAWFIKNNKIIRYNHSCGIISGDNMTLEKMYNTFKSYSVVNNFTFTIVNAYNEI